MPALIPVLEAEIDGSWNPLTSLLYLAKARAARDSFKKEKKGVLHTQRVPTCGGKGITQ